MWLPSICSLVLLMLQHACNRGGCCSWWTNPLVSQRQHTWYVSVSIENDDIIDWTEDTCYATDFLSACNLIAIVSWRTGLTFCLIKFSIIWLDLLYLRDTLSSLQLKISEEAANAFACVCTHDQSQKRRWCGLHRLQLLQPKPRTYLGKIF